MTGAKEATPLLTEDEIWIRAFRRLVPWTMKRHRVTEADAEETVQEAIRQFIQSDGRVDTADAQALVKSLGSRVNGIEVNRRRKKAEQAVALTKDGSPPEVATAVNPEESLVNQDYAKKAINLLLERVTDDELAFAVVTLIAEGVEEPAEAARRIGCDVHDVYNARRRLKTHVEAVKSEMRDV